MDEQEGGAPRSELRLALALRGGVSLAVWIGGACAEIDQLCRASDEGGLWSRALELSGHDRVVVDVLAGASAGGLNGVLSSAGRVYGFDLRAIRDIWVEVGSTNLLRRSEEPWPSLFDGDGYFLRELRERLAGLIESAAPPRGERPPVDLRLSATTVEPLLRPVPSPADEQLVERRHASGFHFRQHAEEWLGSDFPPRGDRDHDAAIARLALAARATSSFPGAFEAAAVHSGRPATFASAGSNSGAEGRLDSSQVFLDRQHRVADGDDAALIPVADGGILDNIPIARALEAVAEAPASGPTRRALVYLHPGAPSSAETIETATPSQRRSTLAVAKGFVGARIGSETIERDIAEIEEHNRSVRHAGILRSTGIGAHGSPDELLAASLTGDARATYVETRIGPDADLVARLLLDPMTTLGRDRFPRTVGGITVPDEVWRSPVGSWPVGRREEAYYDLARHLHARLGGVPAFSPEARTMLARDAQAIRRVTLLLLEWTLLLGAAGLEEAAPAKARLYRVLSFVQRVIEEPRRFAWTAAFAAVEARRAELRRTTLAGATDERERRAVDRRLTEQARAERGAIVQIAADHIDGMPLIEADLAAKVRVALRDGHADAATDPRRAARLAAAEAIEDSCRKVLASLDALHPIAELVDDLERIGGSTLDAPDHVPDVDDAIVPDEPLVDLRTLVLDDLLVPTLVDLARASVRGGGAVDDRFGALVRAEPALASTASLHRAIMGPLSDAPAWLSAPVDGDDGAIGVLVGLEISGFVEMSTARTSRRPVEFVRLSAANRTPIAPAFEALAAAADASDRHWDPDDLVGAPRGIHVDLKLAGNELANFAAFLDGEWRSNDWLWGRLDAVPTLVDLMIRPERLRADFTDASSLRSAIERAVESDDLPWLADLVLGDRREAIAAECAELFAPDADAAASISSLRDALVAARQWEILAEELELTDRSALLAAVAAHDVGSRDVGDLPRAALVDEVSELALVARRVALWNARQRSGRRPGRLVRWGSWAGVRGGLLGWRIRERFRRRRTTSGPTTARATIDVRDPAVDLRERPVSRPNATDHGRARS